MSEHKELLFFEPVVKNLLWGSEHWTISSHENGDCRVCEGSFQGKTLSELWTENRELFGNTEGDKFPLLVKIIDAEQDLSIQVHPDDAFAAENENGAFGKTECWYILSCKQDNSIVIGHNAATKEELARMIDDGEWERLIREQPIHKGDFFQITPGTVHAIKGGTRLLEIQQNSDITYRVYDYNRLSNGKPRELHIEKSKAVISVPYVESPPSSDPDTLVSCRYYTLRKQAVNGEISLEQTHPFLIMCVIGGEGEIDGYPLKDGSHFIIPFQYGTFTLKGNMELIMCHIE